MSDGVPYGCGRCLACKINRRHLWTSRMLLESFCHENNLFCTLTYSDDCLPLDRSLEPLEARAFLKRLRSRIEPVRVRHVFVGEYGEKTGRPHYHAILFGLGIEYKDVVAASWGMGFCSFGDVNKNSIQYVAKYTVKGMTNENHPGLEGRVPEFARFSLKPGIGAPAISVIAEALGDHRGPDGDVPHSLMIGRSQRLTLGRYLHARLRKACGITDEQIRSFRRKFILERSTEMRDLLWREILEGTKPEGTFSSKDAYVKVNLQKFRNVEARQKLKRKGQL